MAYIAFLCYKNHEDGEREVEVRFVEPERWEYDEIIPIHFSLLKTWPSK